MTLPLAQRRALGCSVVSLCIALVATALLLLPQWQQQQAASDGVIVIHLEADGGLRLWNQPIEPLMLPALIARLNRLDPGTRIRLSLAPQVSWGLVQDLIPFFNSSSLDVDLQLPAPTRS